MDAMFVINRTLVDDVLPSLNSSSIVSSLKQCVEDFVRPCVDPGSLSQSCYKVLIPTEGDPAEKLLPKIMQKRFSRWWCASMLRVVSCLDCMAARCHGQNLLSGSSTTLPQSASYDDLP